METYQFDGNWEFNLDLKSLIKFNWERKETSINIIIRDFLDDDIEPYNEQINAITYLINKQEDIQLLLLETIQSNWTEIKENYSFEEWDEAPVINEIEDILKIIRIDTIYIQPLHKDGFSYIGIEGNCIWDEEHGIGFIIYKNNLLQFGGAEEADAMGGEFKDDPDNHKPKVLQVPKIYSVHPTFGTFKPSHQEANIEYPFKLIENGINWKFIQFIEKGNNIDFVSDINTSRTYLSTACMHDNEEIVEYLLPKKPKLKNALRQAHNRRNKKHIDLLLQNGAGLNEKFQGANILTAAIDQYLRYYISNFTEEQKKKNYESMVSFYESRKNEGMEIHKIIYNEMTMHPNDKLSMWKDYIVWLKLKPIEFSIINIDRIVNSIKDHDVLQGVMKEIKWIKKY